MSVTICIAQNNKELDFIINKYHSPNIYCVPLSLETYCYCKKKGIEILNLNYSLDQDKQKIILTNVNSILENIEYEKSISIALDNEILSAYRFTLHSSFYLIELLYLAFQHNEIEKIIISGWRSQTQYIFSIENYIVSDIVENFARLNNLNIISISQPQKVEIDLYKYRYFCVNSIKNYILLNSPAYNFHRIAFVSIFFNLKNASITFTKPTLFKSMKWKLLKHNLIYFENQVIEKYKAPENNLFFNISYKGIDLDCILNKKSYMLGYFMQDQVAKITAIDNFIDINIPKCIFSFSCRGIDGYLLEKFKHIKKKSILVSHGTVSESYNSYDKIYKQIISDAVFSGEASYTSIQSKIAENATNSLIVRGKTIVTGNLIFSGIKTSRKKKYFLYCVTIKDFNNLQLLGVENYFQFLENLKVLNRVSSLTGDMFIIKLHPSQHKLSVDLQSNYPNLIFSNNSIKSLLKHSYGLISFSSTSIEDAITSNVPVILLDLNNCYKHCISEINPFELNQPIYYINNEVDFIQSIKTIRNSNKISFNNVLINNNHYFDNIFDLFLILGFKCNYMYIKRLILNFIYKLNIL